MQRNRRFATWTGAGLGVFLALVMNATLAHAWDDDNNAVVREEFHQTYPLTANGRIELENINGAVHISVWDQNQGGIQQARGNLAQAFANLPVARNTLTGTLADACGDLHADLAAGRS